MNGTPETPMSLQEAKGHMDRHVREAKAALVIQRVLDAAVGAENAVQAAREAKALLETEAETLRLANETARAQLNEELSRIQAKKEEAVAHFAKEAAKEIDDLRASTNKTRDLLLADVAALSKQKADLLTSANAAADRAKTALDRAATAEKAAKDMETRLAKAKAELARMLNPEPVKE